MPAPSWVNEAQPGVTRLRARVNWVINRLLFAPEYDREELAAELEIALRDTNRRKPVKGSGRKTSVACSADERYKMYLVWLDFSAKGEVAMMDEARARNLNNARMSESAIILEAFADFLRENKGKVDLVSPKELQQWANLSYPVGTIKSCLVPVYGQPPWFT